MKTVKLTKIVTDIRLEYPIIAGKDLFLSSNPVVWNIGWRTDFNIRSRVSHFISGDRII